MMISDRWQRIVEGFAQNCVNKLRLIQNIQFMADIVDDKLVVIKWDNHATEYLEGNGFILQGISDLNLCFSVAYVKSFGNGTELRDGMELLLNSKWNVTFL